MSRLTDLIAQLKQKDPQVGSDLEREYKALSSRLSFGLNFERHRPEVVELSQRPVRKGDKVRVLPERGSQKKSDLQLWQVKKIKKTAKGKVAELEMLGVADTQTQDVAVDDLVVVAEFRDTLYPGMVSTGKVKRGGDKPFHTVINGENFHVLKALTYTHRGKVDAIYIDPPYNSGANDWKYNNDYVEAEDLYRHSKWLAMMERRLLIAKELLNAQASLLIVTIDEKEYLRLGLLLEQIFPEARVQMVSSVISQKGVARDIGMNRVDEYIYFVFFGAARLKRLDPKFSGHIRAAKKTQVWYPMMRTGTDSSRNRAPGCFFPVLVDVSMGRVVSCGKALPREADRTTYKPSKNLTAIFPIASDGSEARWQMTPEYFNSLLSEGMVKLGRGKSIMYIRSGMADMIKDGEIQSEGLDENGVLIVSAFTGSQVQGARTQWNNVSHDATLYGSNLNKKLMPDRRFPFPKSLYAVEDTLRWYVIDKPNAIILDFFSGSGTTAHAVMRLNRQDGGQRQCISVTNNEVAADEQKALSKQSLRPGDPEWEQHGICDYITKPRVKAAITGKTPEGKPIKGDYKFTDEFPMAEGFKENAEFFTLTYETPVSVNHNRAFAHIAPLLWLRAGSQGRRIDKVPVDGWEVVDTYGLLVDIDCATPFCRVVNKAKDLRVAYIVTDDDRRFQAIARRLNDGVEPVRLYESYLTNFSFANGE